MGQLAPPHSYDMIRSCIIVDGMPSRRTDCRWLPPMETTGLGSSQNAREICGSNGKATTLEPRLLSGRWII